jgi:hypothetical protein
MGNELRSEILRLVRKNALEGGSVDTTAALIDAYVTELEATEVEVKMMPVEAGEAICMSLYVTERKRLAPNRNFADQHYEAIFEYPLPTSAWRGGECSVPERLVQRLAIEMAVRDHVNDEAMYGYFKATEGMS